MKIIMFSLCWLNLLVILKATLCGAVESYGVIGAKSFYYLSTPTFVNEGIG